MTAKTADIIAPFGISNRPGPYPDVIEALEDILASAKSGEIAGFAMSIVSPGHTTKSRWCAAEDGPVTDHDVLLGVVFLQNRLLRDIQRD